MPGIDVIHVHIHSLVSAKSTCLSRLTLPENMTSNGHGSFFVSLFLGLNIVVLRSNCTFKSIPFIKVAPAYKRSTKFLPYTLTYFNQLRDNVVLLVERNV